MEAQNVKTGTALEMKRVFNAPVDRLFKAWTSPEMMNKWYFPGPGMTALCSVDLKVGGRYEIQMLPKEGEPYIVGGVFQEVVPNEKLVFTWKWKHEDPSMESRVTLKFRPVGEGESELILIHDRFANDEERDSHAEGWEGCFANLVKAIS